MAEIIPIEPAQIMLGRESRIQIILILQLLHKYFMKSFLTILVIFTSKLILSAQDSTVALQELQVIANWANNNTPITFTNVSKVELGKVNYAQDVPYLLSRFPSVVESSDAGAGFGYSNIRIRGVDQTRINVTLNGVPLNDPESHNVFWVNLPDLGSNLQQVQIQRGVGTSTNGAGSFGSSINLSTISTNRDPFANARFGLGSFGTRSVSLAFGTGLLKEKFGLDGSLSSIQSDGYIDRARSNLRSLYLSTYYFFKKSSIRLNILSGSEITYQAWNGVPYQFRNDPKLRKFNVSGTEKPGEPHANEVDNYGQNHYQLIYKNQINRQLNQNLTLHYTNGGGFFEQYKTEQPFAAYGLNNVVLNSDTVFATDLIRNRWLSNDHYGFLYDLQYQDAKTAVTFGLAANHYFGKHFGRIIWSQFASNGQQNYQYYDKRGTKSDYNSFVKINHNLREDLSGFIDLQVRAISYRYNGYLFDSTGTLKKADFVFFNPKLGISYQSNAENMEYLSCGIAQKEPNRDDFTQANANLEPKPEFLVNLELGHKYKTANLDISTALYYMYYRNQLINIGKLNDVGGAIRENIPQSYRSGVEVNGNYRVHPRWNIFGNLNISRNKISSYKTVVYDYSTNEVINLEYRNSDIAYSPNVVGNLEVMYSPIIRSKRHLLELALIGKVVGRQYLDNTSSEFAALPAYYTMNVRLAYTIRDCIFHDVNFSLLLNNITNQLYSSNGWVYRFRSLGVDPTNGNDPYLRTEGSGYYNQTGLFPQAGFNFLAKMAVTF